MKVKNFLEVVYDNEEVEIRESNGDIIISDNIGEVKALNGMGLSRSLINILEREVSEISTYSHATDEPYIIVILKPKQ